MKNHTEGKEKCLSATSGGLPVRLLKLRKNRLVLSSFSLAVSALLCVALAAQNRAASKAVGAEVARGKALFDSKCAVCHYSASTAKKIGPGLKNLFQRGTYANGAPIDDASLARWIEKGGKNMPGLKDSLSAEQIRDLIAYVKTL